MSSDADSVTQSTGTNNSERFNGRVKWFNNKAGYGFVSITDGPQSGTDIFVHHSAIGVSSEQYKYLVQGEYISFNLNSTENDKHKVQAANVLGINGGKLMCETRREFKMSRTSYKKNSDSEHDEEQVKMPRQQKAPTSHSGENSRPQNKKTRENKTSPQGNWSNIVKEKRPKA